MSATHVGTAVEAGLIVPMAEELVLETTQPPTRPTLRMK